MPSDPALTRRRLLGLGLAAAGAHALGPAAPGALAGPRAGTVVVPLPAARRPGVVRVPGGLELAGLRWRGAASAHAELRARRAGGRWTEWLPLAHAHDHGPDGAAGRTGTDPVWTGRADEVELRLSRALPGLALHAVRTAGARGVRARAAQLPGGPPVRIVTRAEWGGNAVLPRAFPEFGQVQLAFVHHTVNANDYGPADSAAMVLAIARYHRDVNRWNDLGYNFVVDRFGQVFEGRAGGIDQAVVGAQAQGYNAVSTGIANLGTFSSGGQSEAALEAMAKLIAWKLGVHGVPVLGPVTVISRGGSANRYPAGRPVTFERIAGHRDGDRTACPGAALYAQLPVLRARAAAQGPRQAIPAAPLTLVLAAPRVVLPDPAQASGALRSPAGAPAAGAVVALQGLVGGVWTTLATTRTAADGTYAVEVPVAATVRLRALHAPAGAAPSASPPVTVTAAARLRARGSARRVRAGRSVRVTVDVTPARPRVVLSVSRQARSGRWVSAGTVRARVRGGRAEARVPLRRAGLYRIIARAPADARAGGAAAPWVIVRAVR